MIMNYYFLYIFFIYLYIFICIYYISVYSIQIDYLFLANASNEFVWPYYFGDRYFDSNSTISYMWSF